MKYYRQIQENREHKGSFGSGCNQNASRLIRM